MENIVSAGYKVEKGIVTGYKAIENGVVTGYKAIENYVEKGYQKIEGKFVEAFLTDKKDSEVNSDECD